MLLTKWSLVLLASMLLVTAAVAQQVQVTPNQLQQTPTANTAEAVQPTCAGVDTGSNTGAMPSRSFDVFNAERSLDFPSNGFRRAGTGSDKNAPPPLKVCCEKDSKCAGCHVCPGEGVWDCSSCVCLPI
jgi:hypothetical protein